MTVTAARLQQDGWRDWLLWCKASVEYRSPRHASRPASIDMLTADGGELLTFALVAARKEGSPVRSAEVE